MRYTKTPTLTPTPSTSTYDELLENTPGESPDDTHLLTTEQLSNKQYGNIIKFYETVDRDGNLQDKKVFIREQIPVHIKIESEPDTGYTLDDWFVTDDEMPSNIENLTYQEIYNNASRVILAGTKPSSDLVDVSNGTEEGNEVPNLYVKLEKIIQPDEDDFSDTSTYDENLSNPGPSPDDSNKLTPEQLSNPTKYANIIKFYEVISEDTGNIEPVGIFIREQTPQIIQMENEPTIEFTDSAGTTYTGFQVSSKTYYLEIK